ncbi:MAG: hypothetical protein ACE5FI_10950, partial [Anaerolineales bacterium]
TATFTPTATFTATSTATATATTAATTYSAGSLSIDQTFHADLDSGAVTSSGSDFWYRAASATQRYVTPENGATIAKAGSSSVGYAGCSTMSLSSSEIHVNDLPAGTYVCVKTSDGRYAEFMVTETVGASPSPLKISYTTWATP